MAVSLTCPKCSATIPVDDGAETVTCSKCQTLVAVATFTTTKPDVAVSTGPPKKTAKKSASGTQTPDNPFAVDTAASEPPKQKSGGGILTVLLAFLGLGLLGCCGGLGAVGWWYFGPAKASDAVAGIDEKPKKKTKEGDDAKKDDANKDGPRKDEDKKDDQKEKDELKDKKEGESKDKKDPLRPPTVVYFKLAPDGSYRSENVLNANDIKSPLTQKTYKVYEGVLEAGETYHIDLVSDDFDAHLFLLDTKNKLITEDDDGGGPPHARIVYQPKSTDAIRIHAAHFDSKDGKFTLTVKRVEMKIVVKLPDDPPTKNADISARVIPWRDASQLVDGLVWARDGKSFYAADQHGFVKRINVATGDTMDEHDFATRCDCLAMSGEGLLLAMVDAKEVWVVDPNKLGKVKKEIRVSMSPHHVSAGRDSKFAVVGGNPVFGIDVVNLQTGDSRPYKTVKLHHFRVTPDGKYLCAQADKSLQHLFIVENNLGTGSLTSFPIADHATVFGKVCLSPDSKFVCLAMFRGNTGTHPDHPAPKAGKERTFIYPVGDARGDNLRALQRPVITIETPFAADTLGFDPYAGFIYTRDKEYPVILYDFRGAKVGQTTIEGFSASSVAEISVLPSGGELLLRGPRQIAHVKVNTKGVPIAKLDPKNDPKNDPTKDPKKNPEVKKDPPKVVTKIEEKDVTHRVIAYKANEAPLKNPVWAADGKAFFVLCKNGTLQRINAETGAVEKTGELGRTPSADSHLDISSEGLVATLPDNLWIIDPDDLTVKKKITSIGLTRSATSRSSDKAIVVSSGAKTALRVVDLEKGTVGPPLPFKIPTFNLRQGGDGKYVFLSDNGRIHRYKVDGNTMIFEESSATIVVPPGLLHSSPDGQYICIAGSIGAVPTGYPERGQFIHAINDLKKPAITLSKVDPGKAVGIDTVGGWIFANETRKPLVIFNTSGVRVGEFKLPDIDPATISEYIVSPAGQAFLIRTPGSVVQVNISVRGVPLASAE